MGGKELTSELWFILGVNGTPQVRMSLSENKSDRMMLGSKDLRDSATFFQNLLGR